MSVALLHHLLLVLQPRAWLGFGFGFGFGLGLALTWETSAEGGMVREILSVTEMS